MTADRYRPLERLGGTASSVHRARDVLLQRDVVVKSFPGEDGHERWERDALLRERLGPGRAMEVLDGAPDGVDGPFVVMPLARDGSLEDATGPSDPASAAVLVARLAAGLGCLHRRGVVHGRVGADAVLLDPALGPRWTGDGAPVPADASPEDDVAALARIAVLAVTGPFAVIPAPSEDVLGAVRALVADAADVGARERLRAGLAARTARRTPRRPGRFDPRLVPAGRSRRAALVACVGALLLGGVLGAGAGITGGDASAAVVAGTIGEPVLFRPAPAQALVALPPAPAPVEVDESPAPPRTEARAPSGGSSSSGMRATSAVRDRTEHRSEPRSEHRSEHWSERHSTERSAGTEDESGSTEHDADDDASTADDAEDSSDADTDGDADDEADGSGSGSGSERSVVGGLLSTVL